MADIFMSYASEDRERARVLAEALESRGWTVWWDREIPIGKAYTDVIEHELMSAGCVMVLWSEESVKSQWVCNEAREGLSRHVLVPVLMDPVKLPLEFRHLQTASLVDWEPGSDSPELAKVESAIRTFSRKDGASAPAPAPPVERSLAEPRRVNRTMFIVLGVAAVLIAAAVIGYLTFAANDEPMQTTTDTTTTVTATESTTSATVAETTETTATTPDVPRPSLDVTGVGKIATGRTPCAVFLVSRTRALTLTSCVTTSTRQGLVLYIGQKRISVRVIEPGQGSRSIALLGLETPADREFEPLRFSRRKAVRGELVFFGNTRERTRISSVGDDGIDYELETTSGMIGTPIIAASDRAVLGVHAGRFSRTTPLQRAIPTASMPDSISRQLSPATR